MSYVGYHDVRRSTLPRWCGRIRILSYIAIQRSERARIPMAHIPSSSSLEAYKCNFFPQTISDLNDTRDSLISSAEMRVIACLSSHLL